MALPNKYRIPYFDVCENKYDSIKDFDMNEYVNFFCDSEYKYTFQCQLQPIFVPVKFRVYGYRINANVAFSIPYFENEETYLGYVEEDINNTINISDLELKRENIQTASKTINPSGQTGVSPVISWSILYKQDFWNECYYMDGELPIKITISSDLFYKILKVKTIVID